MACPFCEYVLSKKEKMIQEGKNVFVILSDPRLMPGHLLVIPKRHVVKLSELNFEERKEFFDTIIEFQEKVVEKFSTGCDLRQNYRPFLKEGKLKVDHVHMHLLPREFEDEYYEKCQFSEKDIFKDLSDGERKKFSKLFN